MMPVYIELLHGRTFVGEDDDGNREWKPLDDWGSDGPIFGPFDFVHATYASRLQLGDEADLEIVDGLVYYDGIGYGDFSLFDEDSFCVSKEFKARHEIVERAKSDTRPLSQTYVIKLEDGESDSPLYLEQDRESDHPCPSWTADIEFATAYTLQKARDVSQSQVSMLDKPFRLQIVQLEFIPTGNRILRHDMTCYIETVN